MANDIFFGRTTRSWARSDVGSILLPAKERKVLIDKIDDVRYDVRSAKRVVGAAVFALAGALGLVGIAMVHNAAQAQPDLRKGSR
jgi:hypothetical protein